VQGCTLRDSSAGQDFQGTYRKTDIEKSSGPCCCRRNSSLSLRGKQGRACLPLDAYLRLIFDNFEEDVLDQELQRDEDVRYLVSSELALLRVREQLLLESAMPASLKVNGGASVLRR